jgi:thiol-disulfide isomerase/thioredoxin
MALTPSNMLDLGILAPDFKLLNVVDNRQYTFGDVRGEKGTLVMFLCKHCPYVIHVEKEVARLGDEYLEKGFGVVAISSNDVEKYPDDRPEMMKIQAETVGFHFPYLYDEDQAIAKSYDAACTPDFYLFDAENKLVYRGRLDDSRPGNDQPLTGKDLRAALDAVIAGKMVAEKQYPSMGCNIKWKA